MASATVPSDRWHSSRGDRGTIAADPRLERIAVPRRGTALLVLINVVVGLPTFAVAHVNVSGR